MTLSKEKLCLPEVTFDSSSSIQSHGLPAPSSSTGGYGGGVSFPGPPGIPQIPLCATAHNGRPMLVSQCSTSELPSMCTKGLRARGDCHCAGCHITLRKEQETWKQQTATLGPYCFGTRLAHTLKLMALG